MKVHLTPLKNSPSDSILNHFTSSKSILLRYILILPCHLLLPTKCSISMKFPTKILYACTRGIQREREIYCLFILQKAHKNKHAIIFSC